MEVITVASAKKGSGKTTTAHAIATSLKDFSDRVLLIDTDPQGDLTKLIQKENGYEYWDRTIRQVMLGELEVSKVVELFDNIYFIPSELRLVNIDKEGIDNYTLYNILDKIKKDYDYCVIDTASNTGIMNLNSLISSDYIILTSKLCTWPIESLDVIYEEIEKAIQLQNAIDKGIKKVLILPTFYEDNWLTEPYYQALHLGYTELLSETVIPKSTDTYDEYMKVIRRLLRINYS